jgi:hypothetical protein
MIEGLEGADLDKIPLEKKSLRLEGFNHPSRRPPFLIDSKTSFPDSKPHIWIFVSDPKDFMAVLTLV